MTPATTTAAVLGCLYGAHALLTEAQSLTAATSGPDLAELLTKLTREMAQAEEDLQHDLNHQLAALLPSGFAYLPD